MFAIFTLFAKIWISPFVYNLFFTMKTLLPAARPIGKDQRQSFKKGDQQPQGRTSQRENNMAWILDAGKHKLKSEGFLFLTHFQWFPVDGGTNQLRFMSWKIIGENCSEPKKYYTHLYLLPRTSAFRKYIYLLTILHSIWASIFRPVFLGWNTLKMNLAQRNNQLVGKI